MLKRLIGSAGLGTALPLLLAASGGAEVPAAFWWFPYLVAGASGPASILLGVVIQVYGERKKARALAREEAARRKLADANPENDAEAQRELEEAKADEAEAEVLIRVPDKLKARDTTDKA